MLMGYEDENSELVCNIFPEVESEVIDSNYLSIEKLTAGELYRIQCIK